MWAIAGYDLFQAKRQEKVMERVLILGSGPAAPDAARWDLSNFDAVVAINNAWRAMPDWTHHIHPDDFPPELRPEVVKAGQQVVTSAQYVPAQNAYGGFVYAGGTMAFTAAYWALHALRPRVMCFFGCDMVYPASSQTHFYGTGAADPLRDDPTLKSLPAKARRLQYFAAAQGCAVINLSEAESVLPYPRHDVRGLSDAIAPLPFDATQVKAARDLETQAGYYVPSGMYWTELARFSQNTLDAIDAMWLRAFPKETMPCG
ncbi:hypothetical protein [Celeribacter sp.]|uniref:hypothetical protein n=1 Tax=Celeribacter sp. TaxID=1890673 RepID=UPI003A94AFAA